MVEIMEFLLNLLLLKGKFLKTTASEALQLAFKKCLQYRRKISPLEYEHMINSFENMLEFINYNARQYTSEGGNCVVTSEVRYRLYEELSKIKEHQAMMNRTEEDRSTKELPQRHPTNQIPIDSVSNRKNEEIQTSPVGGTNERRERLHDRRKIKNQDFIIDNLHAILKSQEFLFKNIIKLVNFLEKDSTFNVKGKKLDKIKKKLAACSDVLSNNTNSRNLADIINNIIEDEITRCRFRHGESKTSAEINLKAPVPRGIEVALETSRKAHAKRKHEVKRLKRNEEKKKEKQKPVEQRENQVLSTTRRQPEISVRRVKSEPALGSNEVRLKDIEIDNENSKQLIEKNEEHFLRCDDALWHSLTTLKYTSLKDEYCNMCKCAFHNKRHFMTFESRLYRKIKQNEEIENMGKFLAMSYAVFQKLENKLVVAQLKPEVNIFKQGLPAIADQSASVKPMVTENPFQKLKPPEEQLNVQVEEKVSKHIKGVEDLKKLTTVGTKPKVPSKSMEIKEEIKGGVSSTGRKTEMVLAEQIDGNSKETNTIINGDNLNKCLKLSENPNKVQNKLKTSTKSFSRLPPSISDKTKSECKKNIEKSSEDTPICSEKSSEKEPLAIGTKKERREDAHVKTEKSDHDEKSKEVKIEDTLKNILLATIEKEITKFVETGHKSQQNQGIKEERSAGPALVMKKEDILLPLPITRVNKIENNLTLQQIIRNQQETNAIMNSQDVRKYTKNVSFPIVKKYVDVSFTKSRKIREMSTEARLEQDQVRHDQEIKIVSLLKKTISCPSVKNAEDRKENQTNPILVDKKKQSATHLQEKDPKRSKNKIMDSGKHIYEKSRKIQESRFKKEPSISTTSIKKADPPKVTHNALKKKYSFPSRIKPPMSVRKEQECTTVVDPSGKLRPSSNISHKKEMKKREAKLNLQQQKSEKNSEPMSLQTVANVDGKLLSVQGHPPQTKKGNRARSLSLVELKSEADLIDMNKKAFDELESTLHTVRIIINKHPVLMSSNTTIKGRKRKMDEPSNKKFSTKPVVAEKCKKLDTMSYGDSLQIANKTKKEIRPVKSFPVEVKKKIPNGKSKTFLKQSAVKVKTEITRPKSSTNHSDVVEGAGKHPLRRTTKTAMKKQQVLTIFPKVSKSEIRAKPKISSIQTDVMRRIKLRKDEVAKHVNFGEVNPKPSPKIISGGTANKRTYTTYSGKKTDRVQCKTGDSKFVKCR